MKFKFFDFFFNFLNLILEINWKINKENCKFVYLLFLTIMRNILFILFLLGSVVNTSSGAALIIGTASVYSGNFEGNKTASGETFSHQNLTAAHRTLPFGTYVRLTRTDIGKSVIVKINDRGPYVNNCIVDISATAAKLLGFTHFDNEYEVQLDVVNPDDLRASIGETASKILSDSQSSNHSISYAKDVAVHKVERIPTDYSVKAVKPKPAIIVTSKNATSSKATLKLPKIENPKDKSPFRLVNYNTSGTKYGIQVASLKNKTYSISTIAELKSKGINDVFLNITTAPDSSYEYKVIVGEYSSIKMAEPRLKMLKNKKINGFIVPLRTVAK